LPSPPLFKTSPTFAVFTLSPFRVVNRTAAAGSAFPTLYLRLAVSGPQSAQFASTTRFYSSKKKKMPPKKAVKEEKILLGRPGNSLKSGIVGLANVGKSTLFQAITKSTLGNPAVSRSNNLDAVTS